MRERLLTLQKLFLTLLVYGLLVSAAGLPLGDDAATSAVLRELRGFQQGFDRTALEKSLLEHARGQGRVKLSDIAAAVPEGYPEVGVAEGAPPIEPIAAIDLSTLEQAHAYGRQTSSIEIVSPRAQPLGPALAWRLTRTGAQHYTLIGASMEVSVANSPMIEREQEVFDARLASLETAETLSAAADRFEKTQTLHDSRIKWHAPWKAVLKAKEALAEAEGALKRAERAKKRADARYEELASQALEPRPSEGDGAFVTLKLKADDGKELSFRIPTPVDTRSAPVPSLSGVGFERTKAAGLWERLADKSPEAAIAEVEGLFSWHYSPAGIAVLNAAPLLFLVLLVVLARRGRRVGGSYNPFGEHSDDTTLPSLGLKSAAADIGVLVGLPLCASALCAWSLWEVAHLPVVPLLCAVLSAALGLWAHNSLQEASNLSEAVRMSHTSIPPAFRTGGSP